jgi:ribose/xylose/arabinose/galactoside ABC-type transport system permease subunit
MIINSRFNEFIVVCCNGVIMVSLPCNTFINSVITSFLLRGSDFMVGKFSEELASLSTFSFPGMPIWLGTHMNLMWMVSCDAIVWAS